jgi:preprotein translocase subunit Sss1
LEDSTMRREFIRTALIFAMGGFAGGVIGYLIF